MTSWLEWTRALAAALALLAAAMPALALDLPELMSLLARQPGGEARFTEQRFVRSLDQPLQASGTLSFAAPDRFTRRTLAPRDETMAVDGNQLTLTRNGRSRSVTLDSAPEMIAIVEAMRGTLTGNAQSLERHFRATPGGSTDAWTLDLVPREAPVSGTVRSVHIAGRGSDVRSVEIVLVDGDRSVMSIEPLRASGSIEPPRASGSIEPPRAAGSSAPPPAAGSIEPPAKSVVEPPRASGRAASSPP